ncbi:hypothetical protein ACFZB9_27060 [Kitasatospora sp. NPDC008050]|uniref:hypothetical protein n=1 Tax=Kitasatospora sp. NPDC008050 TaxID=3364021 RepID=UPI0036EB1FD3
MSADDVWRAPDPDAEPVRRPDPARYPGPGPYPGPAPYQGGWPPPGLAWGYRPPPPRPGVIPLTPLGIGEVISGVFRTLRQYAKPLLIPLSVAALVVLGLCGVCLAVGYSAVSGIIDDARNQVDYQLTDDQAATVGVTAVVGVLVLLCCFWGFSLVASTVSTAVLRHAAIGRRVTAGRLWSESRPYLGRVARAQLLLGLAALGGLLAAVVPAALIGLATGSAAVFGVLLACLLVPAAVFGGYAAVRLALLVPVVVLENQRPVAAIRRAWRLNKGSWWRSLGIPYVVRMIGSFAAQVLTVPAMIIGVVVMSATTSTTDRIDQYGGSVTQSVPTPFGVLFLIGCVLLAYGLATALAAPLLPLTDGLLYLDRRIRDEGLATVLAAEAQRAASAERDPS